MIAVQITVIIPDNNPGDFADSPANTFGVGLELFQQSRTKEMQFFRGVNITPEV